MSVLELEGIHQSYPDRPSQPTFGGAFGPPETSEARQVLRGIDLRIEAATLVAVVGHSGSGKTTLLRIAGGLDLPDAGQVRLAGTLLNGLSQARRRQMRRTHLAFVFQSGNLLDSLTAHENIELALEGLGLSPSARTQRVLQAIDRFGLGALAGRFPHELSSGEQQRIAVARALARRPPVVICDEPTAHLDDDNAAQLTLALRELTSEGAACLLATHDAAVARQADRVVRIATGRIRETASTQSGDGGDLAVRPVD